MYMNNQVHMYMHNYGSPYKIIHRVSVNDT